MKKNKTNKIIVLICCFLLALTPISAHAMSILVQRGVGLGLCLPTVIFGSMAKKSHQYGFGSRGVFYGGCSVVCGAVGLAFLLESIKSPVLQAWTGAGLGLVSCFAGHEAFCQYKDGGKIGINVMLNHLGLKMRIPYNQQEKGLVAEHTSKEGSVDMSGNFGQNVYESFMKMGMYGAPAAFCGIIGLTLIAKSMKTLFAH
ncbi:MAG: hypothetical protein UU47_C0014G0034 [candidate division TM6 bacterium GW2011_GWE2_41_16]|nr:MAG: hypothetical protein UU47_C0014G0034 [candidate division TM6 bacterium GW2011_GWE2_41_16]